MLEKDILIKVESYVSLAASRLNRRQYSQESAYVDAFIGRLDGSIRLGANNGEIDLKATIVADRGPGAAENIYGADFCLVFESKGCKSELQKAVIAQAKNGLVSKLNKAELIRLEKQCKKMASATDSYFVLEAPETDGEIPSIKIGSCRDGKWFNRSIPFHQYLVEYIISCKHGDKRSDFIKAVGESKLTKLGIITKGLNYEPSPPDHSHHL